jgi:hypothetical protein
VNDSGNLVHQSFNGSWSGWVNNFGGIFTSGVDVVAMGPNHLSIVGRGTENGCHHVIIDKTGAVPPTWEFLGGPITGSPAVVSMGVGQLDVFVRAAADNQLYQQSFRSNGWSGFIARGGVLTAGIDGVAIPGRIDLVSRNSANKMVHKTFLNGWSDWTDRGGFLQGDPTIATWAGGQLNIFGQASDNTTWKRSYNIEWEANWGPAGVGFAAQPDVVSWGVGRMDMVALDASGFVRHAFVEN